MNNKKFRYAIILLCGLGAGSLTGCSHFPGAYTLPIHQGNDISDEKVNQLKVGMSPEQVRFLLGTPMLTDAFSQDRWDYVYYAKEKHKLKAQRHLVVHFAHNKVSAIEGDLVAFKA